MNEVSKEVKERKTRNIKSALLKNWRNAYIKQHNINTIFLSICLKMKKSLEVDLYEI